MLDLHLQLAERKENNSHQDRAERGSSQFTDMGAILSCHDSHVSYRGIGHDTQILKTALLRRKCVLLNTLA